MMNLPFYQRKALVTGIGGQDGSYLAELLLEKGYDVHGTVRSNDRLGHAAKFRDRIQLHVVDLGDLSSVREMIEHVEPSEYYHLAAPTSVAFSLKEPMSASFQIAHFVLVALEAIRQIDAPIRFMQAGSSEMFGKVDSAPQNELTAFRPQNPYASAKAFAHHSVQNYREHFGIFACNAILFNHESPRRGLDFVTRKISSAVAKIKLGLQSGLSLGSLQAQRDWGFAGDFVRAFWSMLQRPAASDYVLGTGQLTSVNDFVRLAFEHVQLDWREYVSVDPTFVRRTEAVPLVADSRLAQECLNWKSTTSIEVLVAMMVDHDLRSIQDDLSSGDHLLWRKPNSLACNCNAESDPKSQLTESL